MAKILIADDDEAILRMLVRYVSSWGYLTSTAVDGLQVLESVARDRPDLILLDIAMPGKDGLAVLQELAAGYPDIPVIVTTGDHDQVLAKRCLEGGGADFITKPFDYDDLESRIRAGIAGRS